MTYTILILAPRLPSISPSTFHTHYETHMRLIASLTGPAFPLSHTRYYTSHSATDDKPMLLAGNAETMPYDVVVLMTFADEAAFGAFVRALSTPEAKRIVEADEAGFWDRERMQVVVVGDVGESRGE